MAATDIACPACLAAVGARCLRGSFCRERLIAAKMAAQEANRKAREASKEPK